LPPKRGKKIRNSAEDIHVRMKLSVTKLRDFIRQGTDASPSAEQLPD